MKCFVALVIDDVAMANWTIEVPAWPRVGDVLNIDGRPLTVTRVDHDFRLTATSTYAHTLTFLAVAEDPKSGDSE